MISRRSLLSSGAFALGLGAIPSAFAAGQQDRASFRSDAEWKRILTPQQYTVLRREGTERAGSSPLDREKRVGLYHCASCDLPAYSSATKFDSGTGWPSFYASLEGAVGTKTDRKLFSTRTEVHCVRCEGHLGHVFDDEAPPTGKRHCLNGVALSFRPA